MYAIQLWKTGQELAVHGWIYNIEDGILRDLNICVTNLNEVSKIFKTK
jgi:carbonic anhydrase